MSYLQAIVLAVIQGLTEFLPISSSGHLVIFQKIFALQPPVIFDILVHLGTLGAIVFFFRKQLKKIAKGALRKEEVYVEMLAKVAVGTIPAVIGGLFLQNHIELIFNSLLLVAIALWLTAGFLFSTFWFKSLNKGSGALKKQFSELKWGDAIVIGFFQALAIIPGVSRSGSTIVAALWRGADRTTAFRFSFYLAIPSVLGALILQIPGLLEGQFNYLNKAILGMLIAGVVGYAALSVLEKLLVKAKLWVFGIYCSLLGLVILLF